MKPVLATLCVAFLFSWCSCDQDHVSPDDFVPQVEVLQDNDASTILQNSDQRVIPIYQVFNVINQLVYLLNRVRYPDWRKLLHEHMKDNQATLSDQETQSKRETQNGQDTVLNFAVVPEKNADSGKEHVISGIGDGTDSLAGFSKAEVLKEFSPFCSYHAPHPCTGPSLPPMLQSLHHLWRPPPLPPGSFMGTASSFSSFVVAEGICPL